MKKKYRTVRDLKRRLANFTFGYLGYDTADEKLIQAVITYDIAGIKSALKAGANVNVLDKDGYTPLELAVESEGVGDFDAVEVLVRAGANPNTHYCPFVNAVFIDRNIARYLAQHGADINGRNNSGNTALEIAVFNGYAKDVSFLLNLGVDPNFDNPDGDLLDGMLPVVYAAQRGLLEILKLLVDAGADVPEEALELAEEEGCTKTASYLRQVIAEQGTRGSRRPRRRR